LFKKNKKGACYLKKHTLYTGKMRGLNHTAACTQSEQGKIAQSFGWYSACLRDYMHLHALSLRGKRSMCDTLLRHHAGKVECLK
jgi:hypothetical protein